MPNQTVERERRGRWKVNSAVSGRRQAGRYWDGLGKKLDREDPRLMGQKVELGLCRRYAPQPGAKLQANGADENGTNGTDGAEAGASEAGPGDDSPWPQVASDEWCGEWQPDAN